MLPTGVGLRSSQALEADRQLKDAQERLADIKSRIAIAQVSHQSAKTTSNEPESTWDWTKTYTNWSTWSKLDELEQQKAQEEANYESLLNRKEAFGHIHDHTQERAFFELPEQEKYNKCEEFRMLGNALYKEGCYPRAIECYKVATCYYEYCFPEDEQEQLKLDDVRHACMCNLALCYIKVGSLRSAIDASDQVLRETDGRYVKAWYRKAQAFRMLDEYE